MREPRLKVQSNIGRLRLGVLALTVGGFVFAGCSSSPANTSTNQTTTTSTTAGTAATTTSTTLLPTPKTTGTLSVSSSATVAISPGFVAAAEAPDGAVFVAANGSPSVVWVYDGTHPLTIAEHFAGDLKALAADANNLYVATDTTVTAFSRTTGNQTGQWNLPPFSTANTSDAMLVELSAGAGSLLVSIPLGNEIGVYRINPTSSTGPQLVAQGSSAVFGSNGSIYYVPSDNDLTLLTAAGTMTTGPALANTPNGEGGGVQYLDSVAGGLVWVTNPAGQGEDAEYTVYNPTSFSPVDTFSGSTNEQIVDTSAGGLALSTGVGSTSCPQPSASLSTSCVFRIASSGTLSDPTPVGSATALLGPYPVVITSNAANTAVVIDRLS